MRHSKIKSKRHEDDLYSKLRILSRELFLPIVEPFIRVYKIDRDGNRTKIIDEHCRSFTRNLYNVYVSFFVATNYGSGYQDGSLRLKRDNGTLADGDDYFWSDGNAEIGGQAYMAVAGSTVSGIIFGSGSAEVTFDDYKIDTKIGHGVGAGQLQYSTMISARSEGWNAGGSYYYHNFERVGSNDSGGDVTLRESALYWRWELSGFVYCVLRDAINPEIVVADGEAISVEYELRFSFPSLSSSSSSFSSSSSSFSSSSFSSSSSSFSSSSFSSSSSSFSSSSSSFSSSSFSSSSFSSSSFSSSSFSSSSSSFSSSSFSSSSFSSSSSSTST